MNPDLQNIQTTKPIEQNHNHPPKVPTRSFPTTYSREKPAPQRSKKTNVYKLSAENKKKPSQKKHETEGFAAMQTAFSANDSMIHTGSLASVKSVMSPQMSELFDKLMSQIQIEKNNGISTTTVKIQSEISGSIFDNCEFTLDHYDTAPNSFNLQLLGNQNAVTEFNLNLANLQANLQNALPTVSIQVLSPILQKTSRASFKDKEKDKQNGDEELPLVEKNHIL